MADCDDCPGGDNLVFEINPDPTVRVIVRVDNRVIIPQNLLPSQICINKLKNWDPENNITTAPQGTDPGQVLPLAWSPDDCCVQAWLPPCPEFIDYDPGAVSNPGPVVLANYPVGTTTFYAVNSVTGCADQIWNCDAQAWVCLGSPSSGGGPSPTLDQVCYDVTSWGPGPWAYDNIGGQWIVQATNQIDDICSSGGPVTVLAQSARYSGDYPSGAGDGPPGPVPGWAALSWTPFPGITGLATDQIGYLPFDPPLNVLRSAFEIDFGVAPGAGGGPLQVRMDYVDPVAAGSIHIAMWDTINNTLIPVLGVTGPGFIDPSSNGPTIHFASTLTNGTTYGGDFQLPGGVNISQLRLLAWNMGGGGPNEEFTENIRLSYIEAVATCCNDWVSVADLVSYLNTKDPNGPGWTIQSPNVFCRTVPLGAGAQYQQLSGCGTPVIVPTVTPV